MYIPTLDTGAEVATRFYKELTDIQVSLYNYSMQFVICILQYGRVEHEWSVVI